jgi:hypothetical protein
MRYRAWVCGAAVGWANTGVSVLAAADIAKSCNIGAAVAFGNAGHRVPTLVKDLSALLGIQAEQ